jgi:sarcosine oxidase subunit beta
LLSERFLELFPSFETKQLIRAFAGTVEITPDHSPMFGSMPGYNNLYISAGYNGHGYGMSAVMGKLLAKLIASRLYDQLFPEEIDRYITRFDPLRFSHDKTASR